MDLPRALLLARWVGSTVSPQFGWTCPDQRQQQQAAIHE